jgi:hypothetical protein
VPAITRPSVATAKRVTRGLLMRTISQTPSSFR